MPDLFGGALDAPPRCGEVEEWAFAAGYSQLIGMDEAGRGPLAGPVVAAAAMMPWPCPVEGLNDSKHLSEAKRERLYDEVIEHAICWGVDAADHTEIDEFNILRASLRATARAWEKAVGDDPALRGALALMDGKQLVPLPAGIEQRAIVKGDARSINIAAASILAKVTRDRMMVEFDKRWPQYGFAQHKGYPTKAHRAAVAEHGPCPIHRRSFRMPERTKPAERSRTGDADGTSTTGS